MGYIISGGRRNEYYTGSFDIATPTLGATAVFVLTEQISTDVAKDDAGIPTVTWDHIQDDETITAFLRTYAGPGTGGAPEDILYEDNTQRLGASAVGTRLLCLVRGGLGSDGKRKSWAGVVALAKSSGSFNMSGGTYGKPTLAATAAPIDYNVVIPATYLTCYMVTAALQTMDATLDKYGKAFHG